MDARCEQPAAHCQCRQPCRNLIRDVVCAFGIPSGTCFVEHLPECQWVAIGGPGSEVVDTRDLESLKWIAPAVTTS